MDANHEKNSGRKPRATLPLRTTYITTEVSSATVFGKIYAAFRSAAPEKNALFYNLRYEHTIKGSDLERG